MKNVTKTGIFIAAALVSVWHGASDAFARDLEYKNEEVAVHVNPGEPTQIHFPGDIVGGFKKKMSALSLDKRKSDLIVFANESIPDGGEAIIVRLNDGRTYSLRIERSTAENPRDDVVKVLDARGDVLAKSEEEPAYQDTKSEYAPSSQVSGFMRELVLAGEFGKKAIPGYRASDQYKGQSVLNDGTISATIDRIFIGPNLWGYVIDAKNLLDTTQRLNPATFRLDGTRAISFTNWELAPQPLNVEQQVAAKHNTKVYVITTAKRLN